MSEDKNRSATIGDVEEIVAASEHRLTAAAKAMEDRLIEAMRGMQTELLRGFEAFAQGQTIRLHKLEVDQSNLDTSLSGRVRIVEDRLHQIELKLGGFTN